MRGKTKLRIFHHDFLEKNHRGQFYLIAAMAIIAVVIGIVTIANSSRTTTNLEIVYYLGEELETESEYVLNHGITNELNLTQLMEDFTFTFANSSNDFEFYFIFGEEANLRVYKYFNRTRETLSYQIENNQTKITINELEYIFDLNSGENFYYIILDEKGDEKYITTNSEEIASESG